MSALSIQVPFPVFQDRDGQPLDNGYVWLGTSSLNPQTNPVVAYYDSALTIVATQPLRTINGFISRAGSPAQVYVDAVNFSVLVQDRQGTTVFSVPEGTGISPNASGVVYDPGGTGAVATTVQSRLREIVSASFALPAGYVTDGSVDYTSELNIAISVASTRGAKLVGIAGTYKVTGTGLLIDSPLTFDMQGMIIKNSSGNVLRVTGTEINLSDGKLWSVGGGHTVLQTGPVDQCNWSGMTLQQDATGYSIWENATFDYVNIRHENFIFSHALLATVPGFNLVAAGGLINDNTWERGRCNYSGNYFFNVESTSANFQYSNSWRKLTFEVCNGGGISQKSAMQFKIEDCQNWDCGTGNIVRHFYSIQLNASSIGSVGKILGCGRWAGSNAAGIYDIQLPTGGGGAGIIIENCTTSGGGDPFTADLRNNGVICIIPSFSLFTAVNNSGRFVVNPANNGIQFGGTINGAFLNYYDEGSFSPTLTGGGTFTYSTQVAQWTRKGREVRVIGYIVIATVAGLGGVVKIGAMPYTIPNATVNYGCGNVTGENMTAGATGQLSLNAAIGTTNVNLIRFLAGARIDFDGTLLQAGSAIYFDYAYFVA